MKVKDVVYLAAMELGILDEVKGYVEDGEETGKEKAERLLSAFQMIENELAVDYFPLRTEQEVDTKDGRVLYMRLSKDVTKILYVENLKREELAYEVFVDHVLTDAGKVIVGYNYTPDKKSFSDNGDFRLLVTARLIAYGVVAQYMLGEGRFEEWKIWDKKYKNAITAVYQAPKSEYWQARRWE